MPLISAEPSSTGKPYMPFRNVVISHSATYGTAADVMKATTIGEASLQSR